MCVCVRMYVRVHMHVRVRVRPRVCVYVRVYVKVHVIRGFLREEIGPPRYLQLLLSNLLTGIIGVLAFAASSTASSADNVTDNHTSHDAQNRMQKAVEDAEEDHQQQQTLRKENEKRAAREEEEATKERRQQQTVKKEEEEGNPSSSRVGPKDMRQQQKVKSEKEEDKKRAKARVHDCHLPRKDTTQVHDRQVEDEFEDALGEGGQAYCDGWGQGRRGAERGCLDRLGAAERGSFGDGGGDTDEEEWCVVGEESVLVLGLSNAPVGLEGRVVSVLAFSCII